MLNKQREFLVCYAGREKGGETKIEIFLKIYVLIFSLYRALTSVRGKRERSDREIQSCI